MINYLSKSLFFVTTTSLLLVAVMLYTKPAQAQALNEQTYVQFAAAGTCNDDVKGIGGSGVTKFVFVPWYKYLDCTNGAPDTGGMKIVDVVTKVLVAIIELLTRLAGLVAVGFVVYGSIQYIVSQGEPEGLKNAKNTITNALIGFLIVVLAVSIIQFLGRAIG